MSRRRTMVALFAGVPLVLLLLLSLVLGWVLLTEEGTRRAIDQARLYLLPDNVRLERVEGVLAGPLVLHGLSVDTPEARVRIGRLAVDWDPLALFRSEIRVTRLQPERIDVAIRATPDEPGEPLDPALLDDLLPPVRVVVERFGAEGIEVHLPEGDRHRIDSVHLRAAGGPRGLSIESLDLSAPLGNVRGSVRLEAGRIFGLDGNLRWRARPPDPRLSPLAGSLRFGGSPRRLQARLRVDEPSAASLRLWLRAFADTPAWGGTLRLPATALDAWWSEAPPLVAGAELSLGGGFGEVEVAGAASIEGLPTGPLDARIRGRADPGSIRLDHLRLLPKRRPGASLVAEGEVDPRSDGPRFRLRLDWENLAWPLEGQSLVTSESGSARISGVPEDHELVLDSGLRTPGSGDEPVRVDLRARGSTQALTGIDLRAGWHEARLRAEGDVRWAPSSEARLRLDLEGLDPGRLVPQLSGRVGARAAIRADWSDTLDAAVDLQSFEGTLNGQPLTAEARLRHVNGVTGIERLRLEAGGGHIEATGRVDRRFALDWGVNLPELSGLIPQWSGRLEGNGSLEGTPEEPLVRGSLQATGLASPAIDIAKLTVAGELAPLGGAESSLRAEATGIVTDAAALETFRADLEGTPANHRLEAVARGERGSVSLALDGVLDGRDWQGRLAYAELVSAPTGKWRMTGPAALEWRDGSLALERACWRSQRASACLAATGNPDDWRMQLEADRIPVDLVASLVRDDLEYAGTFGLEAELSSRGGPVIGRGRLELGPGRVVGVIEEEPETLLDHAGGDLALQLSRTHAALDAWLDLSGDSGIRFDGRVGRTEPRSLDGRLRARVENLGLVSVLAPSIGRMQGALVADLQLEGRVDAPDLSGSATLEAGVMELVPLGIRLRDMQAEFTGGEEGLDLELRASSGEGRMAANAQLRRGETGWRGSGRIAGSDFEAVDLPEANVQVSPAVDWAIDGRDITLNGEILIPRARLAPRDLSNTVQSSPDAVIVGEAAEQRPEPERPFRLNADMQVALGPEVRIDAFGLRGRLEGAIRVREQPDRVTEATGELSVAEGTYSIYAQTLNIERGRLLFDGGPAANPGLDVRAVRRPRDVLVGVNVRGRLREPRVSLFSEPPMQESQQLSYLLFGIPLGQASEGEQASLAAAAAALVSSERGSQLAGRFGIQEVTVDHGETGEGASLVLGRYLSPRLYVGYGIGLMEQANSVRVRYDLSELWKVEARSGATSSADLIYSIEVESSADAVPDLPGVTGNHDDDAGGEPSPPTESAR